MKSEESEIDAFINKIPLIGLSENKRDDLLAAIAELLPLLSQNEKAENDYDRAIIHDSHRLLSCSLKIFQAIDSQNSLKSSRESGDLVYKDIKSALICILNIMDFQDPSWPLVREDHLNGGFEISTLRKYILRGYNSFGREIPDDINIFPQIP